MDTMNQNYPALNYPARNLSAFTVCIDIFTISLKNGEVVHFKPNDTDRFYAWLKKHNIRDISKEDNCKEIIVDNQREGLMKRLKKMVMGNKAEV